MNHHHLSHVPSPTAPVIEKPTKMRRKNSVLNSTRNLVSTLKKENERRKKIHGHNPVNLNDPIEQFLRKVDMTKVTAGRSFNGVAIDTEDGCLPESLRCFMKPHSKCILIPDAPGRLLWDLLVAVMILYYLVMVPLRLAFDNTNPEVAAIQTTGGFLIVEILFDLLFILDLPVNFRTAIKDTGELVTDSRLIAIGYCRGWFALDLISSIPTTLITMGGKGTGGDIRYNQIFRGLKWIKLLKLMRVLRLKRITARFEHVAMFWNAGTIRLLRSIALAVTVWHMLACAYFAVSFGIGFCQWADASANVTTYPDYNLWDHGSGTEPNGFQECYDDWVPWNQIASQPFATQYYQAFFWAVMVTTGVGKDINPQSDNEVLFTCFAIMIGVFMFSIIIGSLSSAIQSMDHKSNLHNQQLERINNFMHFNKVPHYMQVAIHQFYEYKWGRPETDPPFSDLPNILKVRLKVLLNRDALLEVPVFKTLPPDCIIALTQHIKSHTLFPTEYSTHQGSQNSHLFIVRHGRMSLTRQPLEIANQSSAKDKWKALLHRWQANEKKRRMSLANTAVTAFRDAFVLSTEQNKDQLLVTELESGNFYGANCLIDEPEDFSCSAIVFSEVLMLDMQSSALTLILEEYPQMRSKLTAFAKNRRAKIQYKIQQDHGIKRSVSMFGGSGDPSEDAKIARQNMLRKQNSKYSFSSNESPTEISSDADNEESSSQPGEQETQVQSEKGAANDGGEKKAGLQSPLRSMIRHAVEIQKQDDAIIAAGGDPTVGRKITALEKKMEENRAISDAQYAVTIEKLEELLANIYV